MDAMLYHRILFMVVWVGETYYNYYNLFVSHFFQAVTCWKTFQRGLLGTRTGIPELEVDPTTR